MNIKINYSPSKNKKESMVKNGNSSAIGMAPCTRDFLLGRKQDLLDQVNPENEFIVLVKKTLKTIDKFLKFPDYHPNEIQTLRMYPGNSAMIFITRKSLKTGKVLKSGILEIFLDVVAVEKNLIYENQVIVSLDCKLGKGIHKQMVNSSGSYTDGGELFSWKILSIHPYIMAKESYFEELQPKKEEVLKEAQKFLNKSLVY